MGKKNKKGISPIIAVILLLMMTVAAAGAAFFWFVRIQSEMQGGTESYSEQLSEKISAKVGMITADYEGGNNSNGSLALYLQNLGNMNVPIVKSDTSPTTTWILQDSEQKVICNSDWNGAPADCDSGCTSDLAVGETQKVNLELTTTCDISNETNYPNDTVFYFKIDFSGVTATGGQFTK